MILQKPIDWQSYWRTNWRKLYVGTKQTEYEYKHKECVDTIHQIDDYINALYGLSEEEGLYIKNFAYRYRIGGGVEDERN